MVCVFFFVSFLLLSFFFFFFFNDTATTEIYTLSLHDALPIWIMNPIASSSLIRLHPSNHVWRRSAIHQVIVRSEEHTSELQSQSNLVCRLLLEKKKKETATTNIAHPHPLPRIHTLSPPLNIHT